MSCMEEVRAFLQGKVAVARSLLSIPSRKESMAGVIILYVFTNSIATSVWMFNAWTPYIYLTFDKSNWHVGLMSATNGVFELVTAFISGYLADRVLGPSRTLRYAVMFGTVTLFVVLLAIWTGKTWMLVLAQMCEGTYMGFSFTCLESVFAQCMRKGERDKLYSIKFAFEAAGPIVGLILTITLFLIVGDTWKMSVLRSVMTAGLSLHVASLITFLCTFVPLPCHLDRNKASPGGAREGGADTDETTRAAAACYLGEARDVAEVSNKATCDVYENEDARLPPEEVDELDLPPLYLSRRTEMINQARTALLQARSFLPRLATAYEPSVCTAHDAPYREADDDGAASRGTNTHSFFSAGGGGGRVSTRYADNFSDSYAGNGSFPRERERGEGDGKGRDADTAAAAADHPTSPPQKPSDPPEEEEEVGRRIVGYIDSEYDNASPCRQEVMNCIPLKRYPALVVLADLILIIGSGMTTQYFSLFMMEIYGVSPVVLTSLNLCNSIIISFMAILNGVMGKKYGRVRALLPTKYIGAFILLYMALSREHKSADGSYPFVHPVKRVVMCVCYVVRNAFMNCSAGLSRALIMDLVSERNRGRWNALESVQSAGWSGTALIGGVVADKLGYGTSFLVTFAFHIFSCAMLTPLVVRNDSRLPTPIYEDVVVASDEAHDAGATVEGTTKDVAGGPPGKPLPSLDDTPQVMALTVANVMRMASSVALHNDEPICRRSGGGDDSDGSDRPSSEHAASSRDREPREGAGV